MLLGDVSASRGIRARPAFSNAAKTSGRLLLVTNSSTSTLTGDIVVAFPPPARPNYTLRPITSRRAGAMFVKWTDGLRRSRSSSVVSKAIDFGGGVTVF